MINGKITTRCEEIAKFLWNIVESVCEIKKMNTEGRDEDKFKSSNRNREIVASLVILSDVH
jgi:hypothetical protein